MEDSPHVRKRPPQRAAFIAAALLLLLIAGVAIGEAAGWPFLARPVERWLAHTLDRRVAFSARAEGGANAAEQAAVRIRFIASLRISAGYIEIGAPSWSKSPHMLLARDAYMQLSYADLWRAHRGEPLRIRELRAAEIDSHIERLSDGRASWQFGKQAAAEPTPRFKAPAFDVLRIGSGNLAFRDDVLGTDLKARFSLADSSNGSASAAFRFDARGHFRKQPMAIEFASNGVLDVVTDRSQSLAWPIRLNATLGSAGLAFEGSATEPLKLTGLKGRFDVHGPSLAAVGDPLGITLPTTGAFRANGLIAKDGDVWNAVVDRALVGSSDLDGAFVFDARDHVPRLSGRLRGKRLLLADLGPAVGTTPALVSPGASASGAAPGAPASSPVVAKPTRGRALPDRPFDLPTLRAMNANVLVDIDDLDLGTNMLEPLRPLRTHLLLDDGVLVLRDIDARTAQGSLNGEVRLDGRAPQALWNADLRWRDVRLERWLHQARANNAPPYVTGRLNGAARVTGRGASTAAILGTLDGDVRMQLVDGSVSHVAVEAAGLDLAQALGVLVKGDDALRVDCGVADLSAGKGALRPRVLVVDTKDSTVWATGAVSLADEQLDLRLVVSPKDFSPLALRTPVRVQGSLSDPQVSIEKRPLLERVGAAALLALVHPAAALLPFFDTGNSDDAQLGEQSCKALASRLRTTQTSKPQGR